MVHVTVWHLGGILCVHACAALSHVNKWLTMESYRETYNHHIHPIPGQPLREQAEDYNRPHAPKIKTKPGKLKMKRRMDVDEKSGFGTKKPKVDLKLLSNSGDGVHLKRDIQREAAKRRGWLMLPLLPKRLKDEGHPAPEQQVEQPQDDGDQGDGESNPVSQPLEIEISQPTTSVAEDSQQDPGMKNPLKLSLRRKSSLLTTSPTVNPLQGASLATSTKFANLMKFVPTPGFKPLIKKN
ncbi:hypothetical protein Ahy_A04g019136 [Arachis hypogaea]|uniref:SWIM-type domain-containing protein n=1 Tax=Arachis hypogaea TaxID=3818 RepID=A0A445DFE9_ARAHY|nr:hypothetical protein Ahy_A04g019136 [Arachis hypogaea]